jgi:hypothetical protein
MCVESDEDANFLLKLAVLGGKWKWELLTLAHDKCVMSVTLTQFCGPTFPVLTGVTAPRIFLKITRFSMGPSQ